MMYMYVFIASGEDDKSGNFIMSSGDKREVTLSSTTQRQLLDSQMDRWIFEGHFSPNLKGTDWCKIEFCWMNIQP